MPILPSPVILFWRQTGPNRTQSIAKRSRMPLTVAASVMARVKSGMICGATAMTLHGARLNG